MLRCGRSNGLLETEVAAALEQRPDLRMVKLAAAACDNLSFSVSWRRKQRGVGGLLPCRRAPERGHRRRLRRGQRTVERSTRSIVVMRMAEWSG